MKRIVLATLLAIIITLCTAQAVSAPKPITPTHDEHQQSIIDSAARAREYAEYVERMARMHQQHR